MIIEYTKNRKGDLMKDLLTEKQVLQKLGILDFKSLTKAKIPKFINMLDKMDPEVAKKALEQYPQFNSIMKETLNTYKNELNRMHNSNDASMKQYYESTNSVISALEKELNRDNLDFNNKLEIIQQMSDIQSKLHSKDLENKGFLSVTLGIVGGVVLGFAAIAAAAVGVIKDSSK